MNGEARLEQQWEPQFDWAGAACLAGNVRGEPALSLSGCGEFRGMPLTGDFSILEP
jgi:hypothetical protein